jgi:hypothetical protein
MLERWVVGRERGVGGMLWGKDGRRARNGGCGLRGGMGRFQQSFKVD